MTQRNRFDQFITLLFACLTIHNVAGEAGLVFAFLTGVAVWIKTDRATFKAFGWTQNESWIYLAIITIFLLKLVSLLWALKINTALSNTAGNMHFLGWPLLVLAFSRALTPFKSMTRGMAFDAIICGTWGAAWMAGNLAHGLNVNDELAFKAGSQNAGVFAHLMCVYALWMLQAWLTAEDDDWEYKRLMKVGFCAALIALLCSTRRIQLVIFVGVAAVLLLAHIRRYASMGVFMKVLLLGGLVAVLAGVWMKPKFELAYKEASSFMQDPNPHGAVIQSSIGNRLEYLHVGELAFKEHPLLGYGAGTRPFYLDQYSHDAASLAHFTHFHNQFLQTLIEVGIVGSLVGLCALVFLWRKQVFELWRKKSSMGTYFALLFIVYMMTGLFSIALSQGLLNSFFVMANAVLWAQARREAA